LSGMVRPKPQNAPGTAPAKRSRLVVATWLVAAGWLLLGLGHLLTGKNDEAIKELTAALTTAGLPAAWSKGWLITADDPEVVELKCDDA
jgi:hypothetical protein